jgi:hypothetical protein
MLLPAFSSALSTSAAAAVNAAGFRDGRFVELRPDPERPFAEPPRRVRPFCPAMAMPPLPSDLSPWAPPSIAEDHPKLREADTITVRGGGRRE